MCIDSDLVLVQRNGPIIGYRVFELMNGSVRSLYQDTRTPWVRATRVVKRGGEPQPERGNDLGFHALLTLQAARDFRPLFDFRIVAKVRGSGIVVRHETGFRSSKMRILAIYAPLGVSKRAMTALRRKLRVPVEYLP